MNFSLEIETLTDKYLAIIKKSNIFNNDEYNKFTELFYKIYNFRDYYLQNVLNYFNDAKTDCKNKIYKCNNCPVAKLTPWRADWNMRCPTGNPLVY